MKTVAFVPAKGNSQRIENKNLIVFDGEYLFKRKLRQLLDCREIDEVWLDSDSKYMHSLATDLPIKHHFRDAELASNSTDGHALFENEATATGADIYVQALCTSPFVDKDVIDPALSTLKASKEKSLLAVSDQKLYIWENGKPAYGKSIPNSADIQPTTVETMSFYAVKFDGSHLTRRYSENPILWQISPTQAIDINTHDDLELAGHVAAGRRLESAQKLKILGKTLNSCLLSDICKEKKIPHMLSPKIRPMTGGKFLGHAKTLELRALSSEEISSDKDHWRGIFSALDTYQFIQPGDVIVVSTDIKQKAYFGDLNAQFAYRKGAVGVVVDGATRDVDRVSQIDLPLFAHGQTADDIRYEGTVKDMNTPIVINDIKIRNNDLIFGDQDGVLCIPIEKWDEILFETKNYLKKEMLIKLEATFGGDPIKILEEFGDF